MNNPFLHHIVDFLLNKKWPLENVQLILPGKRPEVFLRQVFQLKKYNGFLPAFFSIEEFVQQIAAKVPIKGVPLWAQAFEVYQKIDSEESFENFLKWYPTIAKDFNELDIYTEDPLKVLDYMVAVERIEDWDVEDYSQSTLLENNQKFWEKLKPFYIELQKKLDSQQEATSGMMFRQAASQCKNYLSSHAQTIYVFAGFNALSKVERDLFLYFAENANAHFLWDIDTYYFNDPYQEAGQFFRDYSEQYPQFNITSHLGNAFEGPKSIQAISGAKQVLEAKYLSEKLKHLSPDDIHSTAVVLCDENALNTVLESIPENITDINITMGYPLKKNELILFMENLIQFQIRSQKSSTLYLKDVWGILNAYTPVSSMEKREILQFRHQIIAQKKRYIDLSDFPAMHSWGIYPLLKKHENGKSYILALEKYCFQRQTLPLLSPLHKAVYEKLKEMFATWSQMQTNSVFEWEVLPALFQQMVKNESIDFIGKPLEGLQIMGLLETRLLNFPNLYLLNVNEGVIPLGRTENSFIPFDIKKRFQIDTFLENDSVYAYHFLRLLQGAQDIHLLYNSYSEGLQSGEKSRFIAQLELESSQTIKEIQIKNSPQIPLYSNVKTITKNTAMVEKIQLWLGENISPSSLNSYLYNSFDFFQRYILGIKETAQWEEVFSVQMVGTLLHAVMEKMYTPFLPQPHEKPQPLRLESLEALLPSIEEFLDQALQEEGYPLEWFEKGNNLMDKKLAERMIENLIRADIKVIQEGHHIELLALEKYYTFTHEHPELGTLKFGGIIDRVDTLDGITRVIDYKTGKVKFLKFESKEGEFKPLNENSIQMVQLLLYAQMIFQHFKVNKVLCGIYSVKNLKNGVQYLSIDKEEVITPDLSEKPMQQIDDLISEISNPDIPFVMEEKESFF